MVFSNCRVHEMTGVCACLINNCRVYAVIVFSCMFSMDSVYGLLIELNIRGIYKNIRFCAGLAGIMCTGLPSNLEIARLIE